jgi:pectin methylesterase-like acyl-CoA thioesterase/acetyl esterase/lipase
MTNRITLLFFALLFHNTVNAQTVIINGIPRDTSFTLNSAYNHNKGNFPFIQPVYPSLPEGVIAKEGLVYATLPDSPFGKRELHVNLYRPDDKEIYPALIMVHGGGWNSGDLTMQVPMAQQIASKGYVTIPVEYRLIPEAKYPAGLHDLKACVRWVRANAAQYGIDPSRIAISGCSAGAHLAKLVGITNGMEQYEGKGGNPTIPSTIQAIVSMDGIATFTSDESIDRAREAKAAGEPLPVDAIWLGGTYEERSEIWKEASSLYWVSEQSPLVCFINSSIPRFHNGRDEMIEKLDQLGIYSEVHTLPDTPHPFWLLHPWFKTTVNYAVDFLDRIFKPSGKGIPDEKYIFVVAHDGTGDYTTVQDAINAVPDFRRQETVIYIKNGVYREKIMLAESKKQVTLIGEDPERTIIMYDDFASKKNIFGEEKGTSGSASFYVYGTDFTAINICFENTSGPIGQAVAMYVLGDRTTFLNCKFIGFQDTLYAAGNGARQYYRNCYIEGTTDFIFGSGTAWFENCHIHGKVNSYITAANTPQHIKYGYIFNNCKVTTEKNVSKLYLGRPWRPYAMTLFMNTQLPESIASEGWHNWDNKNNELTVRYMEYRNTGKGADTSKRVSWSKVLSDKEAIGISLQQVISGEEAWDLMTFIKKYSDYLKTQR